MADSRGFTLLRQTTHHTIYVDKTVTAKHSKCYKAQKEGNKGDNRRKKKLDKRHGARNLKP